MEIGNLPQPVVILGGGGFIGSNLGKYLADRGHKPKLVDVQFHDWRWSPDEYRIELDLRYPRAAEYALEGAGTVFHLAADMGGVEYFHSDADYGAALDNQLITTNVIRGALKAGVQRLVYSSSVCAYSAKMMNTGFSMHEGLLLNGVADAMYGAEKRNGAFFISQLPIGRVALFDTIYGPGCEHEGVRMKFPAAVAVKALKAQENGGLTLFGDGSQERCYLYIDDCIRRLVTLAGAGSVDGWYNIGGSTLVSCAEVAQFCLDYIGTAAPLRYDLDKPTGVRTRRTSQFKYAERFDGYVLLHETPWQEGFASLIDWLRTVLPLTA